MKSQVIQGNCLDRLKELPENSVDSIVTDPPYELGFMGKSWDSTGIANNKEMWAECLRVLKPGGHLLAFSGTRTYHRMASAIEDAGFEVRDMIEWVYGSGFPKSLNIGKAVDKLQGNEREDLGEHPNARETLGSINICKKNGNGRLTKGTSAWEGWGTALKPAHEPICLARKPLAEKTVAENCLKYGTGGINIDESKVGTEIRENPQYGNGGDLLAISKGGEQKWDGAKETVTGRFPANLIHDNSEEVRECFPESKGAGGSIPDVKTTGFGEFGKGSSEYTPDNRTQFDSGSGNASRFFKSIIYQAKASKSERNRGCEGLEENIGVGNYMAGAKWINDPRHKDGGYMSAPSKPQTNSHPTVKPIALMEYLIKMVTPKGGIVLDPFAGSGSTLVAAKQNGYEYIGIELTPEYIPIINARLK